MAIRRQIHQLISALLGLARGFAAVAGSAHSQYRGVAGNDSRFRQFDSSWSYPRLRPLVPSFEDYRRPALCAAIPAPRPGPPCARFAERPAWTRIACAPRRPPE